MNKCNKFCERNGEAHPDCVKHGEVAVLRALPVEPVASANKEEP